MATRKAKPIPEEEELFEELEEIGEDEETEDLEDLEEQEEVEEEEEVEEPPRRKSAAKKAKARVSSDDPQEIIRTVLVDGILAYIDQQVDEKVSAALADAEEVEEAPRKVVQKAVQKAVKRSTAAPAKKAGGKAAATSQEVREWLQSNGYEVSERGRISEAAKKFYTKKTGRRVAR
jgi:hypothetical protein